MGGEITRFEEQHQINPGDGKVRQDETTKIPGRVETMSSDLSRMSENRSKLDGAMLELAEKMRLPVGGAAQYAVDQGSWTLDELAPEVGRNLGSIEQIVASRDLTLLLAVTLSAWSAVFEQFFGQQGATFQLVDKVRRIRNDYAHNLGDYGDDQYVADSLQAVYALMLAMPEVPADASSPTANTALRDLGRKPFNESFTRFAYYCPVPAEVSDVVVTAVGFGIGGAIDRGIEFLTDQISRRPAGLHVLYALRALFYGYLGDPDLAIRDCYEAIEIDAEFSMAYVVRAAGYHGTKDYNRAVVDATTAISLDRSNGYAFFQRGLAHSWGTDRSATLSDYRQALALNSNDLVAQFNRAFYRMKRGTEDDLRRSINDFSAVIEAMPSSANAWLNRGVCHKRLGRPDLALADYDRTIIVEPENVSAHINRAIIFGDRGEWDASIAAAEKAAASDPGYIEAWLQLSWSYRNKKEYSKAIDNAKRALTIDPNEQRARDNLRGARGSRLWRRIRWSLLIATPIVAIIIILASMS